MAIIESPNQPLHPTAAAQVVLRVQAPLAAAAEVLVCLSCESREKVKEMVRQAVSAGGTTYNEPQDHGFMYGHVFQDLDGHIRLRQGFAEHELQEDLVKQGHTAWTIVRP